MVGKKSPSEDLTRHGVHDRCDAVQEILAIRIREEDSSTLDSPHHDMVESAWGVETWTARHVGSLSASEKDVNGSNGTTSPMALILEDHCGTHVDSPYHFYDVEFRTPRGRTIDEIPIEKFMGEAVLIDVSFKAPKDPVDRALLEAAARDQGIRLMRGDILLVRTWAREWGEPMAEFLQARAFTLDACEWLLGQGVKLVGLDLPNLEGALSEDYGNMDAPGHVLLLHPTHEVLIVENLVNLDQIRAKRFEFYALPLHIKGATGSPVRAVVVEPA